jgi:hypothetical protein
MLKIANNPISNSSTAMISVSDVEEGLVELREFFLGRVFRVFRVFFGVQVIEVAEELRIVEPCVRCTNGPSTFSGPSVTKKIVKISRALASVGLRCVPHWELPSRTATHVSLDAQR